MSTMAIESVEPTVLAYLAGVVDSDGWITVQRTTHPALGFYYCAKVGIAGTRTQPHELAAAIWGARIYAYEPKNPRHRTQYQWSRVGAAAVEVLDALVPYLRVKRCQAELALQLQHIVDVRHRPFADDPTTLVGRQIVEAAILTEPFGRHLMLELDDGTVLRSYAPHTSTGWGITPGAFC